MAPHTTMIALLGALSSSFATSALAARNEPPSVLVPPPESSTSRAIPLEVTAPAEPATSPMQRDPVASPHASTPLVPAPTASWTRFEGWSLGFDLRGEVHALFKIYDGGADGGGGPGLAGNIEVARYHAPHPARTTWGGIAFGAGLAIHVDTFAIGGIDPQRLSGRGVQAGTVTFFEIEPSFYLGGRLGIGAFPRPNTWQGVVLGAYWAPTYAYFSRTERFDGGGAVNLGAFRLTADIGSLDRTHDSVDPLFRLTLTVLPYVNDLPTMITLGAGAAFY